MRETTRDAAGMVKSIKHTGFAWGILHEPGPCGRGGGSNEMLNGFVRGYSIFKTCAMTPHLGSGRHFHAANWWISSLACCRRSDGQDLLECFTDSIKRFGIHQFDPVGKTGLVYCPQLVTDGQYALAHAPNPHCDRWVRRAVGRRQRYYQDGSSRSIDRGGSHQDTGAYLLDFRALRWIKIAPPDIAPAKLFRFHYSIPSPNVTSQSFISAPSPSSRSTAKAA